MDRTRSAALARVEKELRRWSLLLLTDARLPSVAGLVARAPIRGSWWAHSQAHPIFRVAEALAERPGVLVIKLLNGKATYVYRRLWPALFAVAGAGHSWQTRGLSRAARSLLDRVERAGTLRADRMAPLPVRGKRAGDAARELEERLLVYSQSVHTERGSHAKQLESWKHLSRRLRFPRSALPPEAAARQTLEAIAATLAAGFGASVRLPWQGR